MYRKWKEICKKIELSELKFHDLRKTFASLLAQRGVSTAVGKNAFVTLLANAHKKNYKNVDPVLR
jgi:integrase